MCSPAGEKAWTPSVSEMLQWNSVTQRAFLAMAKWGTTGSLGNVRVFHRDLPEGRKQIEGGETLAACHFGKVNPKSWQWIGINDSDDDKSPEVTAKPQAVVFLLDEDHWLSHALLLDRIRLREGSFPTSPLRKITSEWDRLQSLWILYLEKQKSLWW